MGFVGQPPVDALPGQNVAYGDLGAGVSIGLGFDLDGGQGCEWLPEGHLPLKPLGLRNFAKRATLFYLEGTGAIPFTWLFAMRSMPGAQTRFEKCARQGASPCKRCGLVWGRGYAGGIRLGLIWTCEVSFQTARRRRQTVKPSRDAIPAAVTPITRGFNPWTRMAIRFNARVVAQSMTVVRRWERPRARSR